MSVEELEKFNKAINFISNLTGMLRLAIGSAIAVFAFISGMAIWIHTTTAQADQTKHDLKALVAERNENLRDWSKWRQTKDEIDLRLTYVIESQQKTLEILTKQKQ